MTYFAACGQCGKQHARMLRCPNQPAKPHDNLAHAKRLVSGMADDLAKAARPTVTIVHPDSRDLVAALKAPAKPGKTKLIKGELGQIDGRVRIVQSPSTTNPSTTRPASTTIASTTTASTTRHGQYADISARKAYQAEWARKRRAAAKKEKR